MRDIMYPANESSAQQAAAASGDRAQQELNRATEPLRQAAEEAQRELERATESLTEAGVQAQDALRDGTDALDSARAAMRDPVGTAEAGARRALDEATDEVKQGLKREVSDALDSAKDQAVEEGKEIAEDYAPEATKLGSEVVGKLAEPAGYVDPSKADRYYDDIKDKLDKTFGPEDVVDPNGGVAKAAKQSSLGYDNFNKATGGTLTAADQFLGKGAGQTVYKGIYTVADLNGVVFAGTPWGVAWSAYNFAKDGGLRDAEEVVKDLGRRAEQAAGAVAAAAEDFVEGAGKVASDIWKGAGDVVDDVTDFLFGDDDPPAPPDPRTLDDDHDGLSNYDEQRLGTNPRDPDTDGDNVIDGAEVHKYHTNPLDADTDNDDKDDGDEIRKYGTDPLRPDVGFMSFERLRNTPHLKFREPEWIDAARRAIVPVKKLPPKRIVLAVAVPLIGLIIAIPVVVGLVGRAVPGTANTGDQTSTGGSPNGTTSQSGPLPGSGGADGNYSRTPDGAPVAGGQAPGTAPDQSSGQLPAPADGAAPPAPAAGPAIPPAGSDAGDTGAAAPKAPAPPPAPEPQAQYAPPPPPPPPAPESPPPPAGYYPPDVIIDYVGCCQDKPPVVR